MAKTEKKWYEEPQDYPPINSIVLAEYNVNYDRWFKVKILAHDTDGVGVLLMWLEGPSASITQKMYNTNYFKPITTEEKDSPKQEKSLDNLLKELHNLKQEQKAIPNKIDNILKEINSVVGLYGLSILFTNEYGLLQ